MVESKVLGLERNQRKMSQEQGEGREARAKRGGSWSASSHSLSLGNEVGPQSDSCASTHSGQAGDG